MNATARSVPARRRAEQILRLSWALARPRAVGSATVLLPLVAYTVTALLLLVVVGALRYFWTSADPYAATFRESTLIALALLLVPLTGLGAAAARLSARRRDDRLAALRLLGATTRTVAAIAVAESVVLAIAGSIGGVLLSVLVVPLLGLVPFHGGRFGPAALWAGPWTPAVMIAVALIAGASAVAGLRSVVISPLGVRKKQRAARPSRARPLVGGGLVLVAFVLVIARPGPGSMTLVAVGGGLAVATSVLSLVGPWALARYARRRLRTATTAEQILAARGILESPLTAWRAVGGVSMTSFVAVLAGAGMGALSSVGSTGPHSTFAADFRTGIVSTLVASFLIVACATGVAQASAILDRRELYVALDRIGMPRETMMAAQRRMVMGPLVFVTVASTILAVLLTLPLAGLSLILAPTSVAVVALCFVVGVVLVRLALLSIRPLLRSVLAHPARGFG